MTGISAGKTWSRIGPEVAPTSAAASGVWLVNEVAENEGAGTWPAPSEQFELLTSSSISSATQSVTFSAIPQTYRDLRLVIRGASYNLYSDYMWLQVNGDTTQSNYRLYYFGSTKSGSPAGPGSWTVSLFTSSANRMPYGDFPKGSSSRGSVNERQAAEFFIPRYTETSASRALGVYCMASATNNLSSPGSGTPTFYQWTGQANTGTAACTSITINTLASGTNYLLQPGTTLSLYGIGEAP